MSVAKKAVKAVGIFYLTIFLMIFGMIALVNLLFYSL
jgi:hypothetical protein